jgi:hypothetical protein
LAQQPVARQQVDMGMQSEPQFLYMERHWVPEQVLFRQARLPLHWPSPQQPVLGMHFPSQELKPPRHVVFEQTLLLQAKLPGHSLSPQQPLMGMHLPSQLRKPLLHWLVEQVLFTQAKLPVQLASSQQPVFEMHTPAHGFVLASQAYSHLWVEASHLPTWAAIIGQSASLQQAPSGMQVPLQSRWPVGQL